MRVGFKKTLVYLTAAIIFVIVLARPAAADDRLYENYEQGMDKLTESVSDDALDIIGDGLTENKLGTEGVYGIVSSFVKSSLDSFISSVIGLSAVIVACTLVEKISNFTDGKISARFLNLIQTLLISLSCYSLIGDIFDYVSQYVNNIGSLMTSYGVVMSEIYLLGGNISRAAMSSAWLALSIELSEKLCWGILLPVIRICFATVIAAAISNSEHLKSISTFLKSFYVWTCVFVMTVLTVIMSFQSVFAGAGDSIALRSVKFAASNTIPIIGGLVSESLRTLTSALGLMKSESGVICMLLIVATTVIPISYILGVKYTFSFGVTLTSFLGNDHTKGILSECSNLINYIIGLVVSVSLYYLYFVSVFINSVTALGA